MPAEFRSLRDVSKRADQLAAALSEHSADQIGDQRQREDGSREQAYWRYGYMVALRDVLRFLTDSELAAARAGEKSRSRIAA